MKKFSIILVAMALIAMTACKKDNAGQENAENNAPKTEQVDKNAPKISPDVKKAAPTADGKDHTLCEFNTQEYQVLLENLADGTYRLSLWKAGQDKSGAPDQVANCKQAIYQGNNYVMKDENGKKYMIKAEPGKEGIVILNDKEIIYKGNGVK